jgi:uncharacterized protein YdaU (DUF1376 family)
MAPGKSPAFSFYAKDFLTGTATMSLEEVGAYVKLLAYQWDAGSVPDDPRERTRILGCSAGQQRVVWLKIASRFTRVGDAYRNERLETERQKQADRRQRLSDNGSKGGRPQNQKGKQNETNSFPTTQAIENLNERLPSSSSFASSEVPSKNDGTPPLRPLISGEAHPRTWGKIHSEHIPAFCDWVCLPEFVFSEFVRKSPGPEYVRGWAAAVRSRYEGEKIGDNLKFWRLRWAESHPDTAEAKKPFSVAEAIANEEKRKAERIARGATR